MQIKKIIVAALISALPLLAQGGVEKLKSTGECKECDLMGIDLTEIKTSGINLTGSNLSLAYAKGVDFTDSILRKTNFMDAEAPGAIFDGILMYMSNWSGANLNGASFVKTDAKAVSFENADLRDVDMRGARMWGANFQGAKIEGTDFTDAHLGQANLTNVDLTESKLDGVIYWKAKLQGAKLYKKDCEAAKKDGAIMDENTKCI